MTKIENIIMTKCPLIKKMYMDNIFYLVTCLLNYNETRNKIAIQIKYDKLKL